MDRKPVTLAAVAFLLLVPLAGAKWMSYGTAEPDTIYDTAQFMVQNGPGSAVNSTVYFNAYPANDLVVDINPNSGDLETHNDPYGTSRSWKALLGIWTDCNGDGFIGLRETAALEYRAEVLTTPLSPVGTSICPPKVGNPDHWSHTHADGPGHKSGGSRNNWNNWVTEFIPIGGMDYERVANGPSDMRVFFDVHAMVWADLGVPDGPVVHETPPTRCSGVLEGRRGETDEAEGDAHTLGGMLAVADCYHGGGRIGGVSVLRLFDAIAGESGLAFGPDPKHSGSPLNVPVGNENADEGVILKAQDCGSGHYGPGNEPAEEPELVNTRALPPTIAFLDDLTLLRPPPSEPLNTDPASWSVPATLNYTLESAPETPEGGGGPSQDRDCNFDNDPGQDFYGPHAGIEGLEQAYARSLKASTSVGVFSSNSRGGLGLGFAAGGGAGSDRAPGNAGIPVLGSNSRWNIAIANPRPVTREDGGLPDTQRPAPDAPSLTFYAFVDPSGVAGPLAQPRGDGIPYGGGSNACSTLGVGAIDLASRPLRGWECNPTLWYRNADGSEERRRPAWCGGRPCQEPAYAVAMGLPPDADLSVPLPRVHQTISYRDVDCVDGSIGRTGLATMTPGLSSATMCQRP